MSLLMSASKSYETPSKINFMSSLTVWKIAVVVLNAGTYAHRQAMPWSDVIGGSPGV